MKTRSAENRLNRDPTPDTNAEWLVISAGAADAVEQAVRQARERGMRVDHLLLASALADEAAILPAAQHARHIIVVEATGRLADAVQRLLPHIGVIPVTGDAAADVILQRLLFTPRCC